MTLLSIKEITSNGDPAQDISFNFSYLNQSDIKVFVGGVEKTRPADWDFTDANTIDFVSHPPNGTAIRIERQTPNASRVVDFQDGSVLSESDLDNSADQIFFIAQEAVDKANSSIIKNSQNNWEGGGARLANLADPVDPQDAATKASVSAIVTTEVSTAQAAATAAQAAETNAETAETGANTAKTGAETAKTAAEAAKTAAEQAEADTLQIKADIQTIQSNINTNFGASNLPSSLTGFAGQFLEVKSDESGYQFVSSVAKPKFYGLKLTNGQLNQTTSGSSGNFNTADYDYHILSENISFQITNNTLQIVIP